MNRCFTHRVACLVRGLVWGAMFPIAGAITCTAQAASSDGAYTTAQAERGKLVYDERCASCHGASLRGGANDFAAPALAGPFFIEKWTGRPVAELFRYSSENMPPGETRLSETSYLDVTAYILQVLKYEAGTAELGADSPIMKQPVQRNP
jgi:mono/diheme cytochrome c family protein